MRHGASAVVSSRHSHAVEENQLLKPMRAALTELILAGWSDREIATSVRQELESLRRKGDSR